MVFHMYMPPYCLNPWRGIYLLYCMEPTNKSQQIFYIVLTIAVIGVIFVFSGSFLRKPKPLVPITAENTRIALLSKSKVNMPGVKSELTQTALPAELKILVSASAKNTNIRSVVFENNKKGYTVEFSSDTSILKPP